MGRGRRRLDVVGQNSNWANSSTTAFFLVTLYCHRTEIDPCVRRVGSRLNARNWERTGDTQTENCRASRFIVSLCTRWRFPLWRSFRADGTLSIGNPGRRCAAAPLRSAQGYHVIAPSGHFGCLRCASRVCQRAHLLASLAHQGNPASWLSVLRESCLPARSRPGVAVPLLFVVNARLVSSAQQGRYCGTSLFNSNARAYFTGGDPYDRTLSW
jgi:hypothetical protein